MTRAPCHAYLYETMKPQGHKSCQLLMVPSDLAEASLGLCHGAKDFLLHGYSSSSNQHGVHERYSEAGFITPQVKEDIFCPLTGLLHAD